MIQFLMTEEYAENGNRKIGRRKEGTVRRKKGREKKQQSKKNAMAPTKRRQEEGAREKGVRERMICSDLKTPIVSNVATVWKWWVWWYQWLADRNEGLTEQFCCKICSSWLALWNPKSIAWSCRDPRNTIILNFGWSAMFFCLQWRWSDLDEFASECATWYIRMEMLIKIKMIQVSMWIRMGTRTLMWKCVYLMKMLTTMKMCERGGDEWGGFRGWVKILSGALEKIRAWNIWKWEFVNYEDWEDFEDYENL